MVQDNIHCDWTKFIFEVADIKDNHLVINIDIGLLRENTCKSSGGIFTKTLGELRAGATHVGESVVEINNRWRGGLMCERVWSNTGTSIGVDESLVEISFFVRRKSGNGLATRTWLGTTEHESEKTMEGDKISAERVRGILRINHFWQIKWINANIGVEGESNVWSTDCITEFLILVFRVDDDNFSSHHHGADSLKLNCKRFTSTGFSEDDEISIF